MKHLRNLKYLKRAGAAIAVLSASIGLSPSAHAILFQDLPGVAPGDQYVFKLLDSDNGTLYNGVTNGRYGFGESGASANVASGVTALDGLTTTQATGFHTIGTFGDGKEDSWGIAQVTEIRLASTNALVWQSWNSPGSIGDNQQLTMFFYGEQDFYLHKTTATQLTAGTGLHVDLYLQNATDPLFTPYSNTANLRPADLPGFTQANDASYPTVTDSNGTTFINGAPVLQLLSTSGFIRDVGDEGGLATEFETSFTGTSGGGSGLGTSFFDVVGGSLGTKYNTNSIESNFVNKFADISVQFTSTTIGANGWLVSSQDPLRAAPVPEPASAIAGFACLVPILGSVLGRRRKSSIPQD